MPAHLYAARDAPKHESFRSQLRDIGLDIVRWEAAFGASTSKEASDRDFLVYSSRDLALFALCSTPHTEPALVDSRVREDRISIRAGLMPKGERTYQIGKERIEMRGLDVTMVFQAKGQIIRGSGTAPERSMSIIVKPSHLRARIGTRIDKLPAAAREVLDGKRPFYRESRVSSRLLALMSGLGELLAGPAAFLDLQAEATALSFLGASLDSFAQSTARVVGPTPAEAARIEQVRARIDEFPAMHHDIEELSRMAATNRTKLRAGFKQIYGMTLSDYQTAARMRLAERRLLGTDLSLESIAHEVGYSNAASFVVAYKAFFGSTPGRMRRR